MLIAGGVLALSTFLRNPSRLLSRSFAIGATTLMFAFFAAFFQLVPEFKEGWYAGPLALEAVSLFVAAFAMLPVLSHHSCSA